MNNPLYDALFAPHEGSDRVFILDPESPNSSGVSYRDFLAQAAQLAHALQAAGLQPGDRLVAQVGKSVTALALYTACVQAGIVYLPLNTAYTAREVAYFVNDSEARVLVCDCASADTLVPICSDAEATLLTLAQDGNSGTLADSAKGRATRFDTVARNADDLAALLYTSGTTGRSKGAMLTQENLLSNAQTLTTLWQFTANDVLLHALPVFHTHGLFVATNVALLAGSRLLFEPAFNVDRIIELLPRATVLMGVPTFYTRLLDDDRFSASLVTNMRLFISGSAPLLAETHVRFEQRTGHRILERYGMTETNMNTSNPYKGERRAGTVGFPLPGVELKITDAQTGDTLPAGETGLIEVRGPNVFKGYWNMPEKTAEELRGNGFFITGDLGIIDSDGYVSIVGRNKDLIISGGYNIYPKEIELILDDQPGVLESAVVGVPHPDFGESAIGILVAGTESPDLGQISDTLDALLARFKQPRKLLLVDELPRNTMGKVQKNLLRDQYADMFM